MLTPKNNTMASLLRALLYCVFFIGLVGGRVVPPGFVTTSGSRFELDGKPFYFVGSNSYWLPLLTSDTDVNSTFREMQAAGIKVLRTWGFNAINGSELADAQKSGLTYYQIWKSSEWTLNDGPEGLQRLDNVINTAGKYGIKIILTFSNNWFGYGGAELYTSWIAGAGQTHDVFYRDPRIITSYQRYVKTIVTRYKNSPNIFAWELMNEARCLGDLPSGPQCVPGSGTLHTWYKQQSDFVRSLDPHHLITTGGEGHFFWKKPVGFWFNGTFVSDYNFNGQAGEDFDADLRLKNIDFGTYVSCGSWNSADKFNLFSAFVPSNLVSSTRKNDTPGSNFTIESWGLGWIKDHAIAAKRANKPVILEEFGVSGLLNKTNIYTTWVNYALASDHAIMPWQFGMLGLQEHGGNRLIKYADALINGASPNDGLAIYKNQTAVWDIFTRAARVQTTKSG